ncbi:MAG: hypothetical protein U9O82_10655, partial [Thermodesulfobacteriota bacterium]|nr:hypothetical protein [Thermodesulfobacteriota bacterium]
FFPHFALTFFARTNKFVHATHQAVTKNGARLSSPKSVIIRIFFSGFRLTACRNDGLGAWIVIPACL